MDRGRVTELRQAGRGSKRRLIFVRRRALVLGPDRRRPRHRPRGRRRPGHRRSAEEIAKAEQPCARERALRLLAFKDRTAAEVRSRLADDGYCEDVVGVVVDDLLASGLLDDRRTGESIARTLARDRGLGRRRAPRRRPGSSGGRRRTRQGDHRCCMPRGVRGGSRGLPCSHAGPCRPRPRHQTPCGGTVRKGFSVRDAFAAARRVLGDTED